MIYDANRWFKQAEIACAMSLEALKANMKPYLSKLHEARGFPGAIRSAKAICKLIANGDKNFGGVLSTASDIIFAGGTPDEMVRAFDGQTGEIIWERKLPYAASAPPISYFYKGCQYVVFNATGGRFHGFVGTGDATVAFKLDSCVNLD